MIGWTRAIAVNELEPGEGAVLEVRGAPVALYRVGDRFHALGAICPHAGSLLSEFLHDDCLALCPSHGWTFRLEDGQATVFPTQRVPVYPVRTADGFVWIRVRWLVAVVADLLRRGHGPPARRLR